MWGFLEETLERQGKGDQNLGNEPNNLALEPWVHYFTCWGENHVSKLKISKYVPYLTYFYKR